MLIVRCDFVFVFAADELRTCTSYSTQNYKHFSRDNSSSVYSIRKYGKHLLAHTHGQSHHQLHNDQNWIDIEWTEEHWWRLKCARAHTWTCARTAVIIIIIGFHSINVSFFLSLFGSTVRKSLKYCTWNLAPHLSDTTNTERICCHWFHAQKHTSQFSSHFGVNSKAHSFVNRSGNLCKNQCTVAATAPVHS